jgi:hypothetical protein
VSIGGETDFATLHTMCAAKNLSKARFIAIVRMNDQDPPVSVAAQDTALLARGNDETSLLSHIPSSMQDK